MKHTIKPLGNTLDLYLMEIKKVDELQHLVRYIGL